MPKSKEDVIQLMRSHLRHIPQLHGARGRFSGMLDNLEGSADANHIHTDQNPLLIEFWNQYPFGWWIKLGWKWYRLEYIEGGRGWKLEKWTRRGCVTLAEDIVV